jgi:hypothetical protein
LFEVALFRALHREVYTSEKKKKKDVRYSLRRLFRTMHLHLLKGETSGIAWVPRTIETEARRKKLKKKKRTQSGQVRSAASARPFSL